MKRLRYNLIITFIIALAAGIIIRDLTSSKFAVIKSTQAYDPKPYTNNTVIEPDYASDYVEPNSEDTSKININTADTNTLSTLDGIGEGLAQRIIDYRKNNGNFEVIQDIMKVSGIGEKRFEKIKDYITVE